MTTTATPAGTTASAAGRLLRRPWWPWVITAAAFPPAGLVGTTVVDRVDGPVAAVVGGAVTGLMIGAGEWLLLRRRGVSARWIPASGGALAVGLAIGAAAVGYRTDGTSLAVMGALSGLAVGTAQGAVLGGRTRTLVWGATTAALWALGWTVTNTAGVHVEDQFTVFGSTGALAVALVQSALVGALVPDRSAP